MYYNLVTRKRANCVCLIFKLILCVSLLSSQCTAEGRETVLIGYVDVQNLCLCFFGRDCNVPKLVGVVYGLQ